MIEILSILSQFLIFLLFFTFPFNISFLNKKLNLKNGTLNQLDAQTINVIFFLFVSLNFSLFNLNTTILFNIYLFFSIIFLLFNFKSYFKNLHSKDILNFILFFLIVISIFFSIANNLKLEWDGHTWIEKAFIFKNAERISNLKNTLHSNYPHLGSYIWAFFWKNSILELEFFGRFFNVYIYVLSIFLIVKTIKLKNENYSYLLILFFILITFENYYFAGYQEYLIFVSLIFAARYINFLSEENFNNIKLVVIIILILYINSWFKLEGKIYFIIFSIPLVLLLKINTYKKFNLFLLISILPILQLYIEKDLIGNFNNLNLNELIESFKDFLNVKFLLLKIYKISAHIIIAFVKHPLWLIILTSLLLLKYLQKKTNLFFKYVLICLFLNFTFVMGTYMILGNLDLMLRVTLDRVIFQTSGFYLFFLIFLMNNFKFRN